MAAFMNELLKMSMRGIVIILIAIAFRFLLKRLGIGHKYIAGLWIMVFLFFIMPWKVSLPVGFWGNAAVPDGLWMDADVEGDMAGNLLGLEDGSSSDHADNMGSAMDHAGNKSNQGSMAAMGEMGNGNRGIVNNPAVQPQGVPGAAATMSVNFENKDEIMPGGEQNVDLITGKIMDILAILWLTGLCVCFGHMLYSYLKLKRKLALSIPYRDNIWWAENIDMPMVFGLIRPRVYLPFGLEDENLSYVIAHEEMHIRRKDGLLKMAAYVICLVHWFNPFIWAAYLLLGSDLEKACDEEVIRSMEKENRKEYAYALIHIASRERKRKRKVFVAPIGFAEGNLKSRIKNVMKYKYTLPGLGAMVIVVIIALSVLFMTEAKEPVESQGAGNVAGENGDPGALDGTERHEGSERDGEAGNEEQRYPAEDDGQNGTLPVFYVKDLDSLAVSEPFSIKDYYITNRWAAENHYYIDENGVLWAAGDNVYGQFGTGTYGYEENYEEPVRIAEDVVSVDVSENSYFCIYLTENGELYGVGMNFGGILLGKGSETGGYMSSYQIVTEPVLLMTDVAYARSGRECIVALQTNGSAYWWGEYSSTTLSHVPYFEEFWSLEEDDTNPAKMYSCEPRKIMDDCVYITTGTYTGAAINEAGELYVWGLNLFGQCGVPVTEDDYIRNPVKVMDDVKMVWMERISFSDPVEDSTIYSDWSTRYAYNVFLLKEDNTLMAAGLNMGDKEKVTELTGDLAETYTHQYGDNYVPIRAVEYSSELHMQILRELEFGMSMDETENILKNAGQNVFHTTRDRPYRTDIEGLCLCAEHNQYVCVFDDQNRLESILIEEGGSRDGRFTCGMSLSELRETVESEGGELTGGMYGEYFYEDAEQNMKYVLYVYEDVLNSVWEIAM